MDANRDESQKCCKLAKAAILRKDYAKAIKFLNKAMSMYPCDEYRALLRQCERAGPASAPRNVQSRGEEAARNSRSPSPPPAATPQQERACRQVTDARNYYEMLNVPRDASVDDIKRAYKKLALKLHPDKNPHKLASEAFKKLSMAFQCLSNPETRQQYDASGQDVLQGQAARANAGATGMTPEQVFATFFGQDPFTQSPQRNFGTTHTFVFNQNQTQQRSVYPMIVRMLPMLLVILCVWLMHFTQQPVAVFDYERNPKFNHRVTTSVHGVVYYVDGKTFDREYPENSVERYQLEYEVDYRYFDQLCNTERMELQRKVYSYVASFKFPPKELYETPKSCVALGNLKSRYSRLIMRRT